MDKANTGIIPEGKLFKDLLVKNKYGKHGKALFQSSMQSHVVVKTQVTSEPEYIDSLQFVLSIAEIIKQKPNTPKTKKFNQDHSFDFFLLKGMGTV